MTIRTLTEDECAVIRKAIEKDLSWDSKDPKSGEDVVALAHVLKMVREDQLCVIES